MEEKKAYRLREVSNMLGLTRSALHGYDEKGLCHPTEKRGDGEYWYYDEEAVFRLALIELLASAGYSRAEIKEALDDKAGLGAAFLEASRRLEEERKRIVSKICLLKVLAALYGSEEAPSPEAKPKQAKSFREKTEDCLGFFAAFSFETPLEADGFLRLIAKALLQEQAGLKGGAPE